MSQAGSLGNGGSGGSGITTINGDSGSITGSTVTIYADHAANNSGSSVKFVNSGTVSTLDLTDINGNTMLGFGSGNLTGSFEQCVCIGQYTALSLTSGDNHVLIGYGAGVGITTGNRDIIMGFQAGQGYTGAESDNICISHIGITGESNVIRIGTQGSSNGQQNKCFIAGISGVTVTGTAVLCDTNGQLGTVVSSMRYKENVKDIPETNIIEKLRPVNFNYKVDKIKKNEFGLIAEEVAEICPDLVLFNEKGEPETVFYQYLPILLLQEIQKLNKKIEKLESFFADKSKSA